MYWDGYEPAEIAEEAQMILLKMRPAAAPNALILRPALEERRFDGSVVSSKSMKYCRTCRPRSVFSLIAMCLAH